MGLALGTGGLALGIADPVGLAEGAGREGPSDGSTVMGSLKSGELAGCGEAGAADETARGVGVDEPEIVFDPEAATGWT